MAGVVQWKNGKRVVREKVASDYGDPLDAKREKAVLSRADFCIAVMRRGILAPDEAESAARGEWPASFNGFIEGLSDIERAETKITWAGASHIRYDHSLLRALAETVAASSGQSATDILDSIYNIRG